MRKLGWSLVFVLVMVGCSSTGRKNEEYIPLPPVSRQAPAEAPYVDTFVSRPPYPVPAAADTLNPAIEFKTEASVAAKNQYLETVVLDLAKQTGYHPYISGIIAKRRVSVVSSGPLDKVAKDLASAARGTVSVDHIARELRFMAGVSSPR